MKDIDDVHKDITEDTLTPEELELAAVLEDPALWVETHLKNPDNPLEYIKLRWYQRDMIRHQPTKHWSESEGKYVWKNRKKLFRCGRRVGKSVVLLAETLWLAYTNKNYKVLLVTPFENQMRTAWEVMIAMMSGSISPVRIVQKPFVMEFSNGSTIKGFVAGAKHKTEDNKSSPIRGQGADCIGVMEMDHGIDHVLKTVLYPIYFGKAHCRWMGDSTPSGRRGLFHQWATTSEDKGGAKDFHFPSSVSPEWNDDAEREARKSVNSESEYAHEYMAEWGDVTQGVFRTEDLDECVVQFMYDTNNLQQSGQEVREGCKYSMGVDWNQAHGVKIYVVEKDMVNSAMRTVYRHEVPNTEYTQTIAVDKIIEISTHFPLDWIYVDRGFGTVQVELLHKFGKENPESRLHKIVKPVDFKSTVNLRDPWTKQIVKKPLKPFCVANAARVIEQRAILISDEEDHQFGLVGQMRGYKERLTAADNVVYIAENRDDLLVAWMLALLAFTVEQGEFSKYEAVRTIGHVKDPLRLESKFGRMEHLLAEQRHSLISGAAMKAGMEVKKFRPLVPGGKIMKDLREKPVGGYQQPIFRKGKSNSPSKRTTF